MGSWVKWAFVASAGLLSTSCLAAAIGGGLDRAGGRFLEVPAVPDALGPAVPRTIAGSILANLGVAARRRGRLAEAEAYLERALEIHQALSPDGPGTATIWTCDLTQDYFAINADYRS